MLLCGSLCALQAQSDFVNFEGKQTTPIRLSPNGTNLLAVNTPENNDTWCLPRCVAMLSSRFAAPITEEQAAASWQQLPHQLFQEDDPVAFGRFEKSSTTLGMTMLVRPTAPRAVDYDWFAQLTRPTVFLAEGHAYLCTGVCDKALDFLNRPWKAVGVINPTDGIEHWLTTDEFGTQIKLAVEAPGRPCPRNS